MTDDLKQDVFESDPFFNPAAAAEESSDPTPPEYYDEPPVEEDFQAEPIRQPEPPMAEPEPHTSAEERLLNTIVGDAPTPPQEAPPPPDDETVAALKAELAGALVDYQTTKAARDRLREDLQVMKTRFSTLEADLTTARAEAGKANQLKLQAEARHAEAERQWTEKLGQLRHMLGEVEEIRDELTQKRVPKLLFIGTLVTGIIATGFAYFLGTGHATAPSDQPDIPPPVPASAIVAPATPTGLPPVVTPGKRSTPAPARTVEHTAIVWPVLEGNRWKATRTDREMKIVFDYGTFSRGVELADMARQDLKTIATAIKAKGNQFRIEVEGHTDAAKVGSGKSYGSNNKALGLARARAAASYLTKQCGLPSSAVATSSAGEDNPPFPNTTAENQKKNRTVILKIRPAQP